MRIPDHWSLVEEDLAKMMSRYCIGSFYDVPHPRRVLLVHEHNEEFLVRCGELTAPYGTEFFFAIWNDNTDEVVKIHFPTKEDDILKALSYWKVYTPEAEEKGVKWEKLKPRPDPPYDGEDDQ